MPAPITDEIVATKALEVMAPPDVAPLLGPEEIKAALDSAVRATVWTTATAYYVGDVVIPTNSNRTGRRYRCVTAGTSGATEPAWPSGFESQASDGTATWEESGLEYDLWDLQYAAHLCWMKKLAKATNHADAKSSSGASISASQVYDHCKVMAEYYRPIGVA